MSDFFDLSQLPRDFQTSQPAPAPVASLADMAALLKAIDEQQRREHRVIYCPPALADQVALLVAQEGVSGWFTVVAHALVEDRIVVAWTPLDENGEPRLIWPGEQR